MVDETLALRTQYSLLLPGFVRWTEADGGTDPLAHKWPVHRLTFTELATVTIRVDSSVEPPKNLDGTVAGWVAMRLRAHEANGRLLGRSGRDIAVELWTLFFSGPKPRYPYRGFDLLCCADALGGVSGVTVWIDAEPTKDRPYAFRRMRLCERLAELGSA